MKTAFASEGSRAAEKTGSHRNRRALLGCEDRWRSGCGPHRHKSRRCEFAAARLLKRKGDAMGNMTLSPESNRSPVLFLWLCILLMREKAL
jgi:hypothetical protein